MTRGMELQRVGRNIFGRNNLIGTDFEDISVWNIDREFVQASAGGILIQFAISHHALAKIAGPNDCKAYGPWPRRKHRH